jgi:uncharacterized protein (TIGR03437 family)
MLMAQTAVNLTVQTRSTGTPVPTQFTGFSYETSSLTSPTLFYAGNFQLQRMIMQAGPGVLRFGGNSDDKTAWTRTPRTSSTGSSTLTSDDVDRLFAFTAATGNPVLFSLNLGTSSPPVAADEAAYVTTAATTPLQFEIGNEPDLYHSNMLRSTTYTFTDYLAEWKNYAVAVVGAVPGAILTGPADSGSVTTWTVPFAQQTKGQIALVTQHLYPLAPLSAVSPTASNAASIPHLLAASLIPSAVSTARTLSSAAQAAGIPWRMAESNSVYNGGQTGVSDVFASALWGADYMFALASNGASGVNFHGSNTSTYTPITLTNGQYAARPLYYGMLLYRLGAGESGGQFVPITRGNDGLNLSAYAVKRPEGSVAVTLINKDTTQDITVNLNVPGYDGGFSMLLTAPAPDATSGITFGGASVIPGGIWRPTSEGVCSSSPYSFEVPAASALVLIVGGGPLGVNDAAAFGDTLTPGGIASAILIPTCAERVGDGFANPRLAAEMPVLVKDSAGIVRQAEILSDSVGLNFRVPPETSNGWATVTYGTSSSGVLIASVAPAIFTADMSGKGLPAGTLTYLNPFGTTTGPLTAAPIDLSGRSVYLTLYSTGIRGTSQSNVTCTIGTVNAPVTYSGPQGSFDGLDQVNILLPPALQGAGTVPLVLTAAGRTSNAVSLTFQ